MLLEVKKKSLCSEMIGIRRVIQITYIDCGEKRFKGIKKYHKKLIIGIKSLSSIIHMSKLKNYHLLTADEIRD